MSGDSEVEDEDLALYLTSLHTVVRGALFATERWREIWQLNTGQHDDLIDHERYRHPGPIALLSSNLYADPTHPGKRFDLVAEHCRQGDATSALATLDCREPPRWQRLHTALWHRMLDCYE